MSKSVHIEAVIPVFNEEKSLSILIRQLDEAKKELGKTATFSYLFINDGSTDGTGKLLEKLHQERSDLRVVQLIHNFGHGSALACGLDFFQGDLALFMDADLQDPPSALPLLFQEWKNGADTVVVERNQRSERLSFLFKWFYFLLHKTCKGLPPISFGTHSLIDRSVVERMKIQKERHRYFPGLVSFCSSQIASVNLPRAKRQFGSSRVGLLGLGQLGLTAIMGYSSAPIRLVALIGAACSLGSVMGGALIIAVKVFTDWAIPGWASTLSLLFFASGIQLFCLSLLGEYVARIYDEVKQRPLYWVKNQLELPAQSRELQSAA